MNNPDSECAGRPVDASTPTRKRTPKIALFGIFGVKNLGNECTLEAMLQNLRVHAPGASIYTICYNPADTSLRYRLPAIPISTRKMRRRTPGTGTLDRLLRKLFVSVPAELLSWISAWRALRGADLMLMTGTGMLTDWCTSAFGYPYDILKWTVAAKLAGSKVCFVSVGAGPMRATLSRAFIKCALQLSDYRSYRDSYSKRRVQALKFDNTGDPIYPDLAFSLAPDLLKGTADLGRSRKVVGVGLMDYFVAGIEKQSAAQRHSEYLQKMATFICWLLDQGFGIRILQGDVDCDAGVRNEMRSALAEKEISYEVAGIIDEDVQTVAELVTQLASCDFVVSPRYHNLLLSLQLNKPVISISYDPKNDYLLEGFGLAKYCHDIADFSAERLIEQFREVNCLSDQLKSSLRDKSESYRKLLDLQYQTLLENI